MIITVEGAPYSGKTTFCIKLAQELQRQKKEGVAVLFLDSYCPEMNQLFPGEENLISLGEVLDQGKTDENDVLSALKIEEALPNVGYIGYLSDCPPELYPPLTERVLSDFLFTLGQLAPYVIIDQGNHQYSIWEKVLDQYTNHKITVMSPTLKAAAWYGKGKRKTDDITVFNLTKKYREMPELSSVIKEKTFSLPYDRKISITSNEGLITKTQPFGQYRKSLLKIIEAIG